METERRTWELVQAVPERRRGDLVVLSSRCRCQRQRQRCYLHESHDSTYLALFFLFFFFFFCFGGLSKKTTQSMNRIWTVRVRVRGEGKKKRVDVSSDHRVIRYKCK